MGFVCGMVLFVCCWCGCDVVVLLSVLLCDVVLALVLLLWCVLYSFMFMVMVGDVSTLCWCV